MFYHDSIPYTKKDVYVHICVCRGGSAKDVDWETSEREPEKG